MVRICPDQERGNSQGSLVVAGRGRSEGGRERECVCVREREREGEKERVVKVDESLGF